MRDFMAISRNGRILEIVLDRPKANALDAPSSREMGRVFAEAGMPDHGDGVLGHVDRDGA